MTDYCTAQDALQWLRPGSVRNPERNVSEVSTTADTMLVDNHGLWTGDSFELRVQAGGTIPTGLVEGTTYYAIRVSDSLFKVASSAALAALGTAIDITAEGENIGLITPIPWSKFIIEESAAIDEIMVGHGVPFAADQVPSIIQRYTSARVIARACMFCGVKTEDLRQEMAAIEKDFERYRSGLPLRAPEATLPANKAIRGSVSGSGADARGWIPSGGTIP